MSSSTDSVPGQIGRQRRAIIIGGSMGGVYAALYLRQRGWQVGIYERSPVPLDGRGAGITTHPELYQAIEDVGCSTDNLGVPFEWRLTFDQSGNVIARMREPQVATSWFYLFKLLEELVPEGIYHLGKDFVGLDQMADGVVAHFADGTSVEGDVLIGADGFRSVVRSKILPGEDMVYSGYVGWRGLADEARFAPAVRDEVVNTFSFYLPPGEQIIGYPAVGQSHDVGAGNRAWNIVWYRPTDHDTELRRLLTDDTGHTHNISIPPPLISKQVIAELRADAERLLPPQFREAMSLIDQPFFQPIYDFAPTSMAVGRACLIGDAAFIVRPHTGAGIVKVAMDAKALARALDDGASVPQALARFNAERHPVGCTFVGQAQKLGSYIRRDFPNETQRQVALVNARPEAVMGETALLDFARRKPKELV